MARLTITRAEAEKQVIEFLRKQGVPEDRLDSWGTVYVNFTQDLWGDEATVYIHLATTSASRFYVEVSWSSTHRSPSSAAAALENCRQAVLLAQRVEAFFGGLPEIVEEEEAS